VLHPGDVGGAVLADGVADPGAGDVEGLHGLRVEAVEQERVRAAVGEVEAAEGGVEGVARPEGVVDGTEGTNRGL
jgi:hypothetical protein